MGNVNFGIAKATIQQKLAYDLLNESNIRSTKSMTKNFMDIVKDSKLLQLEFKIYSNIENKFINDNTLATKYVDDNISLIKKYSKSQIINENNKLKIFIDEDSVYIPNNKKKLYKSIHSLILETVSEEPDVDVLHESFVNILDYINNNKKSQLNESVDYEIPAHFNSMDVLKIALDKFNERYSFLNESERKMVFTLSKGNETEKKELFESLKKETIQLLESIDKEGVENKIDTAIDKVTKMEFNESTLIKDTMNLYDLKENIIS